MSDTRSWALVSARVKSTEAKRATSFVRKGQFVIGQPLTFDREDPETSAMEYLAAAIAADISGTLRRVARERRLEIDELEVVAQGELDNALMYLGVIGEEGEPSLKKLSLKIYLSTDANETDVRLVWEVARERSPLFTTLRRCVDLQVDLQISH